MRGPIPDTETTYTTISLKCIHTMFTHKFHVLDIKQYAHCKMGTIQKLLEVTSDIVFGEGAGSETIFIRTVLLPLFNSIRFPLDAKLQFKRFR